MGMTSEQPCWLESTVKSRDAHREMCFWVLGYPGSFKLRKLRGLLLKLVRNEQTHWGPSWCGWSHILEGVANSSAQEESGAGGVSALKAACGVCKVVGSRAWLASECWVWQLCWGLLRSTYYVIKWDSIPPKKPRDWKACVCQVLANELWLVLRTSYVTLAASPAGEGAWESCKEKFVPLWC